MTSLLCTLSSKITYEVVIVAFRDSTVDSAMTPAPMDVAMMVIKTNGKNTLIMVTEAGESRFTVSRY
jgi:hypothetical protein